MKAFIISILISGVLIGGVVLLLSRGDEKTVTQDGNYASQTSTPNVSVVDGKQIVEITAQGTYSPKRTIAKSNVPTVIKITTNNTFNCIKSLNFPSLGLRKFLPPTGETLVELPEQKPGSVVKGICSMGMYSFAVNFN